MARAIPLLTPAELRKQPGDILNLVHRMSRAIPLAIEAELRKRPGDGFNMVPVGSSIRIDFARHYLLLRSNDGQCGHRVHRNSCVRA